MRCLDAYGDTLYYFTQWDTNQKLYIAGSQLTEAPMVHFQNKNTKKALVVQSSIGNDGALSADVPNRLLTEPCPISVYIYATKDSSAKAVWQTTIPVRKRAMPEGFLYDGDTGIGDMSEALKQLEEKIKEMQSQIDEISWMIEGNVVVDKDGSGGIPDEEKIYTPEGDTVYLYREGSTSSLIGSWEFSTNPNSDNMAVSYADAYIAIHKDNGDKGNVAYLSSAHRIDFSQYSVLCFEYEHSDSSAYSPRHTTLYADIVYRPETASVGCLTVMQPNEADGTRRCAYLDIASHMGGITGESTLDDKGKLSLELRSLIHGEATLKIYAIWLQKNRSQ